MSKIDYCSMQSRYEENRFNMIWRGGKSFGTFAVEFISWRRHRVLVFFLTQPRPTTYTILISNHIKHTHTQNIVIFISSISFVWHSTHSMLLLSWTHTDSPWRTTNLSRRHTTPHSSPYSSWRLPPTARTCVDTRYYRAFWTAGTWGWDEVTCQNTGCPKKNRD